MAKAKSGGVNKQACEFVRQHVQQRLVRAGWKEERWGMVANLTDQEIAQCCEDCGCSKEKMGALGDGQFLNWLTQNGPALLASVEKIVSLLALFAKQPPAQGKAECDSEEEDCTEDEECDEEETEEE